MPLSVQCIWAVILASELAVLVLLFLMSNSRKLPFFTAYIALNLCQAGLLYLLVLIPGMRPETYRDLAWLSECVTLLAQALATTEILGITLRPYPGIWGLGWRALAGTSLLVAVLVALASHFRGISQGWFVLNRGYHLTFATAVIACLSLIRYYSIQVPSAFKLILGGFCLNSCVEVLVNTLIQFLFHKGFAALQTWWQILTMLSFAGALALWILAVRKPFPVNDREKALLSGSGYELLSPEINQRLREINEKLLRLWKLEARPQ